MRRDLRDVGRGVREVGENVREATEKSVDVARQAGQTSVEIARQAASVASERVQRAASAASDRVGEAASTAGERVGQVAVEAGRTAVGLGTQLFHLPDLVREGARRSAEVVENAGARALVTVIHTSSRVLNRAADIVSELAPKRRVDRSALQEVLVEQLDWANVATEAYDQAAADVRDDGIRVRLVRCKLQAIRQTEILKQLVREIGGTVPTEQRALPPPVPSVDGRASSNAAARQGLGHALTAAVHSAEGWRALGRIGVWAEADDVSDAIGRATEIVGEEPEEHVEFLCEVLLTTTIESVLI